VSTTQDIATPKTQTRTLSPVLSARYALQWQHCIVVIAFVLTFLFIGYSPLFHAVTWRHAAIGESILLKHELPIHAPALPLAAGQRWFASTWLGDVAIAATHRAKGVDGISILLSVTMLTMLLVNCRVVYLLTRRKRFVLVALLALVTTHWTRISIMRPELFGVLCLSVLLWILANEHFRRGKSGYWTYFALSVLFALWSNLDASVVIGVAVLVGWCIGNCSDLVRSRKNESLLKALTSPAARRAIMLTEVAIAATLLQPQGFDLWGDWLFGASGVVGQAMGGLRPLVLFSVTGLGCITIWLVAAIVLRISRRRFRGSDVMLLLVSTAFAVLNSDWTIWFIPVTLFVLFPHIAAVLRASSWLKRPELKPEFADGVGVPVGTFAYSLIALLLIWVGFALSPLGTAVLGGKTRTNDQLHGFQTPLAVGNYVKQHDLTGMVWAPAYWGDWLNWTNSECKVAANSNFDLLPIRVRRDMSEVYRATDNWTKTLDRYGVELLVLDKSRHEELLDSALQQPKSWQVVFDDSQAAILRRKEGS
jgi:hypothetical protein